MAPAVPEMTAAILRNARAVERERLRNLARKNWPDATDDELEQRVRDLLVEKLSKAGKLGRATQQRVYDAGKQSLTVHPYVIGMLEDAVAILRSLTPPEEDEGQAA